MVSVSSAASRSAISGQRHDPIGAAGLYELAGHAPDDGGFFGLGDRPAALGMQPRHRLARRRCPCPSSRCRSAGSAGHAPSRSARAGRCSDATDSRPARRGHGDQAGGAPRHDQVGVAAPDVGAARLEHHRTGAPRPRDGAQPVEPPGERAGEARGHVLRDRESARESRPAAPSAGFQRRRSARRGADQHQSVAVGGGVVR